MVGMLTHERGGGQGHTMIAVMLAYYDSSHAGRAQAHGGHLRATGNIQVGQALLAALCVCVCVHVCSCEWLRVAMYVCFA